MRNNLAVVVLAAAVLLVAGIGVVIRFGDDGEPRDAGLRRRPPSATARSSDGARGGSKPFDSDGDSASRRVRSMRSGADRDEFVKKHGPFIEKHTSGQDVPRPAGGNAAEVSLPKPDSKQKEGTSLALEVKGRKDSELSELAIILTAHPDADERASAAFFLGSSDEREAVPILEQGLNDPDAEVRLAVVESLGDLADYISPSMLASAIKDPDPEVRLEAATVLADMENREACQLLKLALEDPNEEVRMAAEGVCD